MEHEMPNDLKYYSELAQKILNDETPYSEGKKCIKSLFKGNLIDVNYENLIFSRLSIIDNLYSTNLSKRYFGISDITIAITKLSNNDEELITKVNNYMKAFNTDNIINEIFFKNNTFGLKKNGSKAGKASSLISKYFYFLTDYNFPIYDSLAKASYKLIHKLIPNNKSFKENINTYNYNNYFEILKKIQQELNINNYDQIDNLLWIIGKIKKGNYSLILKKDEYTRLINKCKIDKETKSSEIDSKIKEKIELDSKSFNDIFKPKLLEIIYFTQKL